MTTLDPARRRALRAQAHHLHPVVSIGQQGLTPAVLHEIDVNLLAHELVKIRVFNDDRDAREALMNEVCDALAAAPVQHVGKVLVLYRAAPAEEREAQVPSPRGYRQAARPGREHPKVNAATGPTATGNKPRHGRIEPLTAGKARELTGTSKRKPSAAAGFDRRSPAGIGKGKSAGDPRRGKSGVSPAVKGRAVMPAPAAQRRSPAAAPSGVPRSPRARRRRG